MYFISFTKCLHRIHVLVHHLWIQSKKVKEKEVCPIGELVVKIREYKRLEIMFMLLGDQKLLSGKE